MNKMRFIISYIVIIALFQPIFGGGGMSSLKSANKAAYTQESKDARLIQSAKDYEQEEAIEWLAQGADPNIIINDSVNDLDIPLLSFAVIWDLKKLVKALIAHPHIRVNNKDERGKNSLSYAIEHYTEFKSDEALDLIKQLLGAGADSAIIKITSMDEKLLKLLEKYTPDNKKSAVKKALNEIKKPLPQVLNSLILAYYAK